MLDHFREMLKSTRFEKFSTHFGKFSTRFEKISTRFAYCQQGQKRHTTFTTITTLTIELL